MKLDLHTVARRWVFLSGFTVVMWTVGYILAAWLIRYHHDSALACGFFLGLGAGSIGWSLTYASDAASRGHGFEVLEAHEVAGPSPDRH